MNKDIQEIFYKSVAEQFYEHRKETMTTFPDLVRRTGEQYNTIQSIENGSRFMFHHALWMMKEGMDLNQVIQNAAKAVDAALKNIQVEDFNEQREKSKGPSKPEEPIRRVNDFF